MFFTLLVVTFCVSAAVSVIVALAFSKSADRILNRIIADEISVAWHRYIMFAIFVVGISSGVRIWDLEKYITKPHYEGSQIVELTGERWVLEVYRTIIGTLQGVAWVLVVFFVVAMFAYLITRVFEQRRGATGPKST